MTTTQLTTLEARYPITTRALRMTYYPEGIPCQTQTDGTNEAGYILAGLNNAGRAAIDLYGARGVDQQAWDRAAAREALYQWDRQRQFRRTAAGLSGCWANLVVERPERLYAAARRGGTRASASPV